MKNKQFILGIIHKSFWIILLNAIGYYRDNLAFTFGWSCSIIWLMYKDIQKYISQQKLTGNDGKNT